MVVVCATFLHHLMAMAARIAREQCLKGGTIRTIGRSH